MTVLGETVQFSVSNALLLPSAAYIEYFMSKLDQYMEDFFEDESVLCVGNFDKDDVFWDELLMDSDAADVGQKTRLLDIESRNCEEELNWFDSLLVEEETKKNDNTQVFADLLKIEAQTTATEKDSTDSNKGDTEIPKVEVKELPSHLKYAFLGENSTFPVIIAAGLEKKQEEELFLC